MTQEHLKRDWRPKRLGDRLPQPDPHPARSISPSIIPSRKLIAGWSVDEQASQPLPGPCTNTSSFRGPLPGRKAPERKWRTWKSSWLATPGTYWLRPVPSPNCMSIPYRGGDPSTTWTSGRAPTSARLDQSLRVLTEHGLQGVHLHRPVQLLARRHRRKPASGTITARPCTGQVTRTTGPDQLRPLRHQALHGARKGLRGLN